MVGLEFFYNGCIIGRNKIFEDPRPAGGLDAICTDKIFDPDGNACQRTYFPFGYLLVCHIGRLERIFFGYCNKCIHLLFNRFDTV